MIKCLPQEVQGKLRSGVAVPSLQQCVEELILNSIDAEATCVGVRMDTEALKVQLIDNGTGISAEDMDCVGNRYHTSKCNSVEDLDNLRWYGFRGEALASIVSLATLVEITSRTRSSMTTYVKMFKNGKGLDVFKAETARPSAGTTVIICNFFHNMPVRRKRLDAVLEGERIRHRLEAISLMHPSVSFTLKNDCTGAMMVQLPKAKNTYHRFVQIHSLGRAQKLGEVVYTHGQFEVTGYIGREGHYSNSLQFLYVNERLLLKTRIHKLLNFLLRSLGSSNQKNEKSPDGQTANRSLKHKRSQDLYGVYIINIKCSYSEYDICLEPAKTLIEFKDWDGILLCVEEAVKAFMRRENLVAVFSQDDLDYASSELLSLDDAEQEEEENDKDGQGTSIASTLDFSIGMKLASESVYRKRKGDCVSEDNICRQSGLTERKEDEDEKIQSEGCIYEECRDESQFDEVQAAPDSISNITEKEEQTFSSAEEGSRLLCESRLVRQRETEKTQISKEREIQLNNTTPASNVILSDSITQQIEPVLKNTEQLLPDCQGTEGHRQTLISNRKISLSDPFIHPSLQAPCLSQINKLGFQQLNLTQKGVERSFTSKCKISVNTAHIHDTLHKDSAPVVPSKIPRIEPCPRLSLCQETGSLDKFRRIFGKSDKMKLPSLETRSQKNERLPQTTSLILNPLTCQKDQQDSDVAQAGKNETQCKIRSLPTLSALAKLKPAENKSKISLSAKLCHMKQFKTEDFDVLPDVSRTTSQERTCPGGGNDDQDSNNNENCCDTALNPEPDSDFTTNPGLVEKDEDTTSGDWFHHYDTSVGKMVYVNKVTGLSKYEEPATEETQVCCTSDVTNMAVSVISETGMEYRCYPFQVDLVLPFLPKSRTERVISSGLEDRGTSQTDQAVEHDVGDDGDGEDSNSLSSMYSKWKNPVFVRPPMVGVDITSGQADGLAVKIHNILFPYRFSKTMIHSMKVIHQVDKKFLACLINTRDEDPAAQSKSEGNLLVLVDQHAAHERVRLEHLVADSYEDPDASGERRLCSSTVSPPLEISVTEEELRLLRSCQTHLHSLGLEMKFSEAADPQVFVGKVPMCFVEKESNELKRGRSSVIKSIVEEYLREQIELLRSAGRVRGTLPLTVLKVLASLACHGAIKFNDSLSRDECHSLVASLSCCQLPFQCAHGRPSIAPLVDTLHLDKDQKELQKPNLQKLRRLYKAWELYGNR